MPTPEPLLALREVSISYPQRRRASQLRAVQSVSLEVPKGSTLALVGESGSGKSSIAGAILGLVPLAAGSIALRGEEAVSATNFNRSLVRRTVQAVFQDPFGSLNPGRTIGQILVEPLMVHRRMSGHDMEREVVSMLAKVGLPSDAATRYPANFSGGQRQRVAIARALMATPELVVCDEPVSALDLSVQAQVLNLLAELQEELDVAYLLISHDIAVVRRVAHEVAVLYQGRIVEWGRVDAVCGWPSHPYTRALVLAAPVPDPRLQRSRSAARREWAVQTSRADHDARGCSFAARCPFAADRCRVEEPRLRRTELGPLVACHFYEQLPPLDTAMEEPQRRVVGGYRNMSQPSARKGENNGN